ncbi:MAG: beta-lactamase family protein [Proteobacteria bacterium]|nr:beta-lactamase family protein [Pseudomonadota bacterium]MBU1708556.1 beta-lactamase family protein [Pseudomonadota bacterium]
MKIFPGATVGISARDKEKRQLFLGNFGKMGTGKKYTLVSPGTIYDLASLTKPLVTTLSLLSLLSEQKISLDQGLGSCFDGVKKEKKEITIRHLLNHSSGLPDHRPYFKELVKIKEQERKRVLVQWILAEKAEPPGKMSIYSDLGFFILGEVIEKITGKPLNVFAKEKLYKHIESLDFKLGDEKKILCAATERCPWRKRVLQGEVHDQNTSAVGGVSGQAGLFGDVAGVLTFCEGILGQWKEREAPKEYDVGALKEALTRQKNSNNSTWGLGFDTPRDKDSSAGKYLSRLSAGHLGFTGTSFWIDPERDLIIVLLTNRIHPTSANNKIKEFRPLFHDTVVSSLGLI